jgi:hypothetical protein
MTTTAPNQTQLPPDADLDYEEDDEPTSTDDRDEWDQKVLQIEAVIRRLSLAELNSVFDFAYSLLKQHPNMGITMAEALSEEVFARSWNSPEDDAAWGSLTEGMSFTSLFLTRTSAT